jgi:hypothetical protein
MERPPTLREKRRIRRLRDRHAVTLVEMDKRLPWTLADGSLQCYAGYSERRRPRYRLEELTTGLGRVRPDFDPLGSIRRFGGSTAAAIAYGLADIGALKYEIDAAAVFHSVRSYFGFQPRAIPLLMMHEAV